MCFLGLFFYNNYKEPPVDMLIFLSNIFSRYSVRNPYKVLKSPFSSPRSDRILVVQEFAYYIYTVELAVLSHQPLLFFLSSYPQSLPVFFPFPLFLFPLG